MRVDMWDRQKSCSGGRCSTPRGRKTASPTLTERAIRCLWYSQHLYLKRNITSLDGRTVHVVSPGHWNTGRGPDFRRGVFCVGKGSAVCGDVEIHRKRTDWKAHGHHRDPSFKNVRLHVFMGSYDGNGPCVGNGGKRITEVCLQKQIRRNLSGLIGAIKPERYPYAVDASRGRCSSIIQAMGARKAVELLREQGGKRLSLKASRVGALTRKLGEEQAIYLLLLESLGYASCKKPFAQLAARLPWDLFRRIVSECGKDFRKVCPEEILLMGTAGLIPDRPRPEWDSETKIEWRKKHRAWKKLQSRWGLDPMDSSVWKRWGSRPANNPSRRLSAISALFSRAAGKGLATTLFPQDLKMDRHSLEDHFREILSGHGNQFWQQHYTWGGERLCRPAALLGPGRNLAIIATVLLPVLFHKGGEDLARTIFNQLPASAPNSTTRFMRARLFGGEEDPLRHGGIAAQQGLIHVYKTHCARDRSGCRNCAFPSSIQLKTHQGVLRRTEAPMPEDAKTPGEPDLIKYQGGNRWRTRAN